MKTFKIYVIFFLFPSLTYSQKGTSEVKWFTPDLVTMQYAGSIGFLSAGTGYEMFKSKANIELLIGYVPSFTGSKNLQTLTLKYTAKPVRWRLNQKLRVEPLTLGIYFCYSPGREYSSDLPSWYPDGYYWWSEAIRVNIFIGGSADISIQNSRRRLSAYYEIGTNEIKLVSYVQNKTALNIWSILHASLGVRFYFRPSN